MKTLCRIISLFLILFVLVSCNGKKEENHAEILKGHFESDLSITSKDGGLSYELKGGILTVTHPEILKGTEIFLTNEGISAKLYGQTIRLPQSFMTSSASILKLALKLASDTYTELEFEDGVLLWEDCQITVTDEQINFISKDKEFIIQRIEKDETSKSHSEPESNQQ